MILVFKNYLDSSNNCSKQEREEMENFLKLRFQSFESFQEFMFEVRNYRIDKIKRDINNFIINNSDNNELFKYRILLIDLEKSKEIKQRTSIGLTCFIEQIRKSEHLKYGGTSPFNLSLYFFQRYKDEIKAFATQYESQSFSNSEYKKMEKFYELLFLKKLIDTNPINMRTYEVSKRNGFSYEFYDLFKLTGDNSLSRSFNAFEKYLIDYVSGYSKSNVLNKFVQTFPAHSELLFRIDSELSA